MKIITLLFLFTNLVFGAQEKFILDTDSNYFADDCLALGMILQSPQLEIQGMTIVAGTQHPKQGIEYLTHIMAMFNRRDLPVYLGEDKPLVNNLERVAIMREQWGLGFAGAFDLPLPTSENLSPPIGGIFSGVKPQNEPAFDYIVRTLEQSPEPLTILAIGPLTNIARIVVERKDLVPKIGKLIFMGGNVRVDGNVTKAAEFNFWFDPEAAQIVLRSEIANKLMVGLDLTSQARFVITDYLEVLSIPTPLAQTFAFELWEMWPGFKQDQNIVHYIWDAIIPVYLLDPSIVTTQESLYLDVETDFGPDYGGVKVTDEKTSKTPVTVFTGLDYNRFRTLFLDLLRKP